MNEKFCCNCKFYVENLIACEHPKLTDFNKITGKRQREFCTILRMDSFLDFFGLGYLNSNHCGPKGFMFEKR